MDLDFHKNVTSSEEDVADLQGREQGGSRVLGCGSWTIVLRPVARSVISGANLVPVNDSFRKEPTMIVWLPRWIACLVLAFPFVAVVAADAGDAEIARLVKQLGHDEFEKREDATTRLKEIGEPALDPLTKATMSSDPEVRRRAEDIVTILEKKLFGEHLRFRGHTGEVWTVCVSGDGKHLLTGGTDRTLRLWDAETGKCLRLFEGHTERIVGAALSPDSQRVLSGSCDKTVRVWDATTGKELRKYEGHTLEALSVAFGPKGLAISGGSDRTMILWVLDTGKKAGVFTGRTSLVRSVAYSGKAKLAATSSYDQSIRMWNLETGKEVRTLTGHTDFVHSVCFSADGKRLLSSSLDGTLRIWDPETGKELKRLTSTSMHCAAFSPDGKRIVSAGYLDKTVRVWDAESGKELRKYEGHTGAVLGVAFFPDGKRIASCSADGTACIWSAPR